MPHELIQVQMRRYVLLTLFLLSSSASNAFDVAQYRQVRSSDSAKANPILETFLNGVARGFIFANVQLERSGITQFYCQPASLALNGSNLVHLVDGELARDSTVRSDLPIEFVVMSALKRAFPCT